MLASRLDMYLDYDKRNLSRFSSVRVMGLVNEVKANIQRERGEKNMYPIFKNIIKLSKVIPLNRKISFYTLTRQA